MSAAPLTATWAVVTGASRGIGRATARALHERGLKVALVGRLSAELSAVADACGQATGQAAIFDCDLSDEAQTTRAATALGALSPAFLFNVAGVIQREAVADLTAPALNAQVSINLLAPMLLTKGLLPYILLHARGAIINVGSISATLGTAKQSVYNATKWGLLGFTKCLAEELSGTSALCVAVLPGAVDTDMLHGSAYTPRMTPEEVALTLIHYALDAPRAHNGATVEMFGV